MKKLILIILLSSPLLGTTFTTQASGPVSVGATFVGGTAPNCAAGGDLVIVATGHTLTGDIDCILGVKTSAVGDALTINATNAVTFGTVTWNSGKNLTLRGFNTTTARLIRVNQFAMFNPASGSTVTLDEPSDWASTLSIAGNWTSNGVTYTVPAANITWSNAGARNLAAAGSVLWDATNFIYILKLTTGTNSDPGPISNSAGTGLGSFGNTSFSPGAGTTLVTEVSSLAGVVANGNYYIDYGKGIVWYKSGVSTITNSITFKYATYFGYGITATANATGSALLIDNNTFSWCGSNSTTQTEFAQYCIYVNDHFSPTLDSTRAVRFTGNTWSFSTRPLQLYATNVAPGNTNSSNHISVSTNTFSNCRWNIPNFSAADGLINLGDNSFVDFNANVFNTFTSLFVSLTRGSPTNITVTNSTGALENTHYLPFGVNDSSFTGNVLTGFGAAIDLGVGNVDPAGFDQPGSAGHPNTFSNNNLGYGGRLARLDNNMVITGNTFYRAFHHGMVFRPTDGYISGLTVTYNVIYDSLNTGDFPGGWTLGYNRFQWIDNITIQHNTFDSSTRCINFNDSETTVVLGTRLNIIDNICSNNNQGIFKPTFDANNISSLAITKNDWNDDFNNTANPTNVKQGTFMKGGVEYNSGARNVAGVYLFNPQSALPDATSRSIVSTITGVAGTNLAINIAWGGGTAVNFVAFQGTVTSATNPGGGPPTLTDSGAAFTTAGSGLKAYQVIIAAGTGAGQYGMIAVNTGQVLTIIPNTLTGNWVTTPDATSKYLIIKPDQLVTASGGLQTISIGINSPELAITGGPFTDSGITIATNSKAVNPTYKSSTDFRPTNSSLATSASDGTFIGALAVSSTGVKHRVLPF